MQTVVLTSLFPPDTSIAARYTKLLAAKLPPETTAVIAYGTLPESIPGMQIHTISKRSGKLILVYRCLKKLHELRPETILLQNGPSSELPAVLYTLLAKVKIVFIVSDHAAAAKTRPFLQRILSHLLQRRSVATVKLPADTATYLPPEELPFSTIDRTIITAQKMWWENHLAKLLSV